MSADVDPALIAEVNSIDVELLICQITVIRRYYHAFRADQPVRCSQPGYMLVKLACPCDLDTLMCREHWQDANTALAADPDKMWTCIRCGGESRHVNFWPVNP